MNPFSTIGDATSAVPELATFLGLVQRTNLYRSWVPRKAVTMLAPMSHSLTDLGIQRWPVSRIELFVLRHTLPGRLQWERLEQKSRLITLSGDLIPVGTKRSMGELLNIQETDIMVEGMMVHLMDGIFPPSALLSPKATIKGDSPTSGPVRLTPQNWQSQPWARSIDRSEQRFYVNQSPGTPKANLGWSSRRHQR